MSVNGRTAMDLSPIVSDGAAPKRTADALWPYCQPLFATRYAPTSARTMTTAAMTQARRGVAAGCLMALAAGKAVGVVVAAGKRCCRTALTNDAIATSVPSAPASIH